MQLNLGRILILFLFAFLLPTGMIFPISENKSLSDMYIKEQGQVLSLENYEVFALKQNEAITSKTEGWQTKAEMPNPRSEIGAAEIDGKVYVVGGLDNKAGATDKVFVYDVEKNTWSQTSSMPLALHHVGVAAHAGKLYVVGGYLDGWRPSDSLLIYDTASDSWNTGDDMLTARGALTAEFVGGVLYAVGGFDPAVHKTNEAYDPKTNTWTKQKQMPTAREHLASAVLDGKLYVIGGRKGGTGNLDANEVYDPANDSWEKLTPLPTPRSGLAASAMADRIFVFGGESSTKTFDENESYDPKDDTWKSHTPMPTPRHGLSAVAVGDKIHVVGGGLAPGFSFSALTEVYHNVDVTSLQEQKKDTNKETAFDGHIPSWVRDVFVWYGDKLVSERELIDAIEYLVNHKIIKLEQAN